jgi:folate-binding protein YgfZ
VSSDGNPFLQQRELLAGKAIVPLPGRGVITITGPDRLSWLDSLTSQSLTALQPGQSAETLLLDPSGRVEHAMRVVDDGETTWLLVDDAPALAAWLDRMRFMLRVEVTDRSADFITVGTFGEFEGVVTWQDPWPAVVAGGHSYASGEPGSWRYRELLVTSLPEAPVASEAALDALRIAAWRPRQATEGDDRTIPHELDWLRSAVHLSKGCYRGQETVAKVHNLGHPPRRLVLLHLDGVLPAAGDPVVERAETEPAETEPAEPREVGRITSAAQHYELGPIALAVIKRGVDPAATLIVRSAEHGDIAAAQEVIVPPSAGAEANVPRLPRLGAVTR